MELPYAEPLNRRILSDPVIPEPPRRGDPGGEPCRVCPGEDGPHTVWSDRRWILNHAAETSIAGTVWLTTRDHVDSFADLDPDSAREFGSLAGRIDRALLALPNVARVHVYRWGDGGAHFHVWFLPRPLGMLQAQKMMLPLWEELLPPATAEAIERAKEVIRARLLGEGGLKS